MAGTIMDDIFADRLISRNPDLLSAPVDDHLVLLDSAKGEYYDLDPIAADIWERLAAPQTAVALRDQLVAAYEGEPDLIGADMQVFLADMLARGLVRLESP